MENETVLNWAATASYAIQVQGALDPGWSQRLGGMRITTSGSGRRATTALISALPDQAALLGVLNTLYELGFPVISVQHMPPP